MRTLDGAILQIDQFHSNYSGFRKIGMHTFDKRDFGGIGFGILKKEFM